MTDPTPADIRTTTTGESDHAPACAITGTEKPHIPLTSNGSEKIFQDSTDQRIAELEQKIAEMAVVLDTVQGKLAEQAVLSRNMLQHSRRTLVDCSEQIETFATSWMFYPVRRRLRRLHVEMKKQAVALASANSLSAGFSGRSSNPYHDKFSTHYYDLKSRWRKQSIPPHEQQREWLEFRRSHFEESGELEQIRDMEGIHAGKRCFIIGNGPSLNSQDLSFLRDEITFVANWFVNADQYSQIEPKYYCVSSHEMFGGWNKPEPFLNQDYYMAMQKKARGAHKFFSFAFRDYVRETGLFPDEKVNFMLFENPKRLVDECGEINLDPTRHLDDGYTVIQTMCAPLAAHFGCTEIYLIGCDCNYGIQKPDDPKQYCYDSKLHTTATTKFESLDRIWAENGPVFKSYSILEETLRKRGIKLFNATHGGRLEVLPRVDYRSLFT